MNLRWHVVTGFRKETRTCEKRFLVRALDGAHAIERARDFNEEGKADLYIEAVEHSWSDFEWSACLVDEEEQDFVVFQMF